MEECGLFIQFVLFCGECAIGAHNVDGEDACHFLKG
jgi:hypothetical protein